MNGFGALFCSWSSCFLGLSALFVVAECPLSAVFRFPGPLLDAFGSTYAAESNREESLWASRIAEASVSRHDFPIFAELNSEVCGLSWCKITDNQPQIANLFQMWVAPEARGKGAGRHLLQAALVWAAQAGAQTIQLGVTVADSAAMRLYVKHGFIKVGEVEPLREDTTLVAQNMRRALGTSAA